MVEKELWQKTNENQPNIGDLTNYKEEEEKKPDPSQDIVDTVSSICNGMVLFNPESNTCPFQLTQPIFAFKYIGAPSLFPHT